MDKLKEFFKQYEIGLIVTRNNKPIKFPTEDTNYEISYPEITDTMFLELLCLLSSEVYSRLNMSIDTVEELKQEILQEFIDFITCKQIHHAKRKKIKKLVQSIVKEKI